MSTILGPLGEDEGDYPWRPSFRTGPVQFMHCERGRRVATTKSLSALAERVCDSSPWELEDYYLPQGAIEFELRGLAAGLRLLATSGARHLFSGQVDARAAGRDAALRLAQLFPGDPWLLVDCSRGVVWCGLAPRGVVARAAVVGLYPLAEPNVGFLQALDACPMDGGERLLVHLAALEGQQARGLLTPSAFIQWRCMSAGGRAFAHAQEDLAWIEGFPIRERSGARGTYRDVPSEHQEEFVRRRNAVLVIYLPIVVPFARSIAIDASLLEEQDFFSVGAIGLLVAIDHYDSSRGSSFAAYAQSWVRQRMTRELQNAETLVRVPVNRWWPEGEPDVALRPHLGLEDLDERELSAVEAGESWSTVREERGVHQQLLYEGESQKLARAIKELPGRDRRLVVDRYGLRRAAGKTLDELGRDVGLTRERVRQLLGMARAKLTEKLSRSDSPLALEAWEEWAG